MVLTPQMVQPSPEMANRPGSQGPQQGEAEMPNGYVWYELMTTDQDAAEKFYADVVGWKLTDSGMPGLRYTLFSAGENVVGGIMAMPEMKPYWFGYVGVDSADAYAEKVKAAGGSVHKGPADIPGVGRFAIVADPQGAVFSLFEPGPGNQPPPAPYMAPGSVGWNELHTTDLEAGFAFYAALFGWEKDEAIDMGPGGPYQLVRMGGGHPTGAMHKSDQLPQPAWVYYFSVPGIDAAKAKVEAGGGTIVVDLMEVPGGMWVLNATDPQGTLFALVGPRG